MHESITIDVKLAYDGLIINGRFAVAKFDDRFDDLHCLQCVNSLLLDFVHYILNLGCPNKCCIDDIDICIINKVEFDRWIGDCLGVVGSRFIEVRGRTQKSKRWFDMDVFVQIDSLVAD